MLLPCRTALYFVCVVLHSDCEFIAVRQEKPAPRHIEVVLLQLRVSLAFATFARLQQAMRDLIARERAAGDAAATQSLHRVTVGHETVICMVLRTFSAILPEAAAMLTQSYLRLASAYRALDQPMAVGWSIRLAHSGPPRFATEGSCQLPILPAIFDHYFANPIGWFVEVLATVRLLAARPPM